MKFYPAPTSTPVIPFLYK